MGVQQRRGPAGGEPGRLPGPENASPPPYQRGHNVVRRPGAEAVRPGVGALLRRPRPPPVPQEINGSPHFSSQGFQEVQVHPHVRYCRQKQE